MKERNKTLKPLEGGNRVVLIKVSERTRAELKNLGRKGESYDDIIRRLIDRFNKEEKEVEERNE